LGKYPIQNFTPADYNAGIQNIDFAQNRDMTLYIANNLGVLAYNGNEWEVHAFKNGKKQRSLAFDNENNRLYVGSQNEFGFFHDDWQYVSLIDQIPSHLRDFDEVWDVYIHKSSVYFCTFQGIYVYDGELISVIEHPLGFDRSFLVNGNLYTQSKNGHLFEIKEGKLVSTPIINSSNQIIASIVQEDEGTVIFYNSGKIAFLTSYNEDAKYQELIDALQGTYVNHVLQLSDSRLVVSTQTSGLFLFNIQSGEIEHITTLDGLKTNACLRAFQDYAGNVWVGMQNGVALIYINSPIRLINQEINIQGSGYEAYDTGEGTYYATSTGLYFLDKVTNQSRFLSGTEGPAYGIQEIAGKLYAGHHTGLFLLEGAKATKLATTHGMWQIKQLRSNGQYAIAGTYSGLYLFKIDENQLLRPIQKIKGFNESSRFLEEDQQGNIIVGQYYKGLFQLELQDEMTKVNVNLLSEQYDSPQNFQDQIILSKIDNELYIASNTGLYKIDQTNKQIVADGIFTEVIGHQPVYLIKQDHQKNVHVIAENLIGFFKQISVNNYVFVPSSLFQLRYYLNNDLLQSSVNINNGIMFSANDGFLHYHPELEDVLGNSRLLMITKVYSVSQDSAIYSWKPFESKPDQAQKLVVDQRAAVLQFKIESFQFRGVNTQQFRYFLKGFDLDYGEWSPMTTKEYTNLREGSYELYVQSRNHLGGLTTSEPLYLTVKPPFYRSLTAKILYVILGLLAFFMLVGAQKRRFKEKEMKLEKRKEMELAAKQQKFVKIEQQKEEELKQMEEAKLESELQHLNNLLAASTMNLVVKNEFIENIKQELKDVRKKGKNPETKKALERIEKEIDSTLRVQEDWKQFEYHFDKVHGDFLGRLRDEYTDLSPNDQKLCAFLRLNLSTKEIANLMSISLRGVEVARYRLRRKLNLQKGQNLSKFIIEY
jgi:ligand-binding sensor domain-containing protein/DNA-binding CsgD family transcriptional regulator